MPDHSFLSAIVCECSTIDLGPSSVSFSSLSGFEYAWKRYGNDSVSGQKNILSVFAANLSRLVRTGPEEKQMKIPYVFHILEN